MSLPCLYLYGVVRAGTEIPADLPGIDGEGSVSTINGGRLGALVGHTSRDGFESDEPPDPAWVVPRALNHEFVVEQMLQRGPILPVRFGALFSTRDAVAAWTALNHDAIARFLDHVADKQEWTLKIQVETDAALDTLVDRDPAWSEKARRLPASAGARYFQEKRLREEARQHVRLQARAATETVRRAACALAEERILVARKSDQPGVEPVASLAYLVPRDQVADLLNQARRVAAESACLRLIPSGPWPPAHFCPPLRES